MESPLSFNSSENFRKKLLVRNLKPYSVNQVFNSSDIPGISDITLIDYSVIDSPSIEDVGYIQEGILYTKNQYAPNNEIELYGDTVEINLNLNTQTNQGVYGFNKTIGSKLETIGDTQENLLYVNNLYGPQGITNYGNTVNINQNLQSTGNLGEYDLTDSIGSKLETIGNFQEVLLYTNNAYGPQGVTSYGDSVDINQNLQTLSNLGEYDITDSVGSKLETIGNFQEIVLYTNNIYGPDNSTSYGDSVNINQNLQTLSNQGEYGPIVWSIQRTSDQSRNIFYVLNEFGPDGTIGYGNSINSVIDTNLQTSSNQGEYQTSTGVYGNNLTLTLTVPKTANQSRNDLYVVNEFGPGSSNGYGDNVNPIIYTDLISQSNQGEYDTTPGVYGDDLTQTLTVTKTPDQSRTQSFLKNEYGPDNGFGNSINPIIDSNLQTTANAGIYNDTTGIYGDDLTQTLTVTKTPIQSQAAAYGDNKYVSGDGSYEDATITDVTSLIERTFLPYADSETTFIFVPSTYSPYQILLSNDPVGSDGPLSDDSSLAQLGAERLNKEFKARVALELLQQTLNKVNAFNSSIDTDTGDISVKPNTDPFNAIGIVSGNIPLFARDFSVTRPDLFLGQGINFAAKLAGLYSPYSYIPGEYFDYPKKRVINELLTNPVGAAVNAIKGLVNKITSLNIESGSELFLANTSNATSDLLFEQLSYNSFRPDYRLNSLRDPNLLAPKPSYYVGDRKTFLKSITPIDQQPLNRFGDNTEAPVFGHGGLGSDYENYDGENLDNKFFFGLTTRGYYDGANNPNGTDSGTVYGGFTWGSSNSNSFNKKVGYNNETYGEETQDATYLSGLKSTLSGDFDKFRPDSILDVTQKLVTKGDQASGIFKQRHVGTAINQVSKVFNDGNIELTKGSRVIRYSTPNSVGSTNPNDAVGYEYCRVFTKDRPYYTYGDLQKSGGAIRKGGDGKSFTYSVLDNTYNLNIAPTTGNDSTTIDPIAKKVKKYMFSLENLAWRTSNRKGYTVEDLPVAERGPGGGRIMWFPPYALTFDESVKTTWQDHTFLGRTEPVYTYSNTSRSGSLGFKIVVDHPSTLNLIVNKELAKTSPESKLTKIVDSFFAGCTQYDIYDLLKKFAQFTIADVYDVLTTTGNLDTYADASGNLPQQTPNNNGGGGTDSDLKLFEDKAALFFDNSVPKSSQISANASYDNLYQTYLNRIDSDYPTEAEDKIIKYTSNNYTNEAGINTAGNNFFANYIDATKNGIQTFKGFIEKKYTEFNSMASKIETFLSQNQGNKIELELVGGASSTASDTSNTNLGKRRVTSVENWLKKTNLKKYIDNKQLTFKDSSKGEKIKISENENNYNQINCSKSFLGNDANNRTGTYSVNAMACRIVKVGKITTTVVTQPNQNSTPEENPSVIPDAKAATDDAPNSPINNGSLNNNTQTKPQPRQDIVKRLLRKLLTESDYFEMIKENEPMIYDGIKQKIKHFNPAFHSITPEGLNSRLTFLQQCMRPGDTIPTVQKGTDGTTNLVYGDAFNTAFGAPPVCILRIGDFFHTKVIIDSLSIKYDEAPFDLNPEGIGVQPMIADVTMNFNFIGGQGLAKPIEQLQNALSFNYYANTEMYDERAEETEPVSKDLTKELLDLAQDSLGILTDLTRPDENNGQTTIGTILNQNADPTTNTITGEIQYKDVFLELLDNTKNYFTSTYDGLKKLNDELLYGGIVLLTKDRKYKTGEMTSTVSNDVNIFGYGVNYQTKIDDLFDGAKKDVDNDNSPLLRNINLRNFKNSEIRDYKKKIKELIDGKKADYVKQITEAIKNTSSNTLKLVNLIDKLNFVAGDVDGYKNKQNKPIIYSLSGRSDVVTPAYADTLAEYKGDLGLIVNDLNVYNELLYLITPQSDEDSGSKTSYNDNYDFDLSLTYSTEQNRPYENRLYMIFGKEIITKPTEFMESLKSSIQDSENKLSWEDFIKTIIFGDELVIPLEGGESQDNSAESQPIVTGSNKDALNVVYKVAKQKTDTQFTTFDTNSFYAKVKGVYQSDLRSKGRVMLYQKQDPTNQTDGDNLLKLWQSVSVPDDKFNFKKQLTN